MSEESSNSVFRDFIYIDRDRLYSLHSQIFKGVAESFIEAFSSGKEDAKNGKRLEESLFEASYKVKNVILLDHIYNSLENELASQLLLVNESTTLSDLQPSSYIKVSGKATIEDYERLIFLFNNFNDIGKAFATIQLQNADKEKEQGKKSFSKNNIAQYAKDNGLYLEENLSKSMVKIIENFHGSALDVTIEPHLTGLNLFFKATLDDRYLRFSSNTIRKTYGIRPIMDWTMVGEITNYKIGMTPALSTYSNGFFDMFEQIEEIDNSFENANDEQNKIIRIAPIAVYIEHNN